MSLETDPASTSRRLHLFVTAVIALAAVGGGLVAGHAAPSSTVIPLWSIVVGAAVAELLTTVVHVRGESIEVTLSDMPVVFGLSFAHRIDLLIGIAVGVAVVRLAIRRQPPIKFAFNVFGLVLDVVVAIAVFDAINSGRDGGPASWFAALVALLAMTCCSGLVVSGVISVATGRPQFSITTLLPGLVVSLGTGSVALAAAAAYRADPKALALFLVPVGLVYSSFVAFERQRLSKERIEFLYRANRTLTSPQPLDVRLLSFLADCVEGLHATSVEIVVRSAESGVQLFHARATETSAGLDTDDPSTAFDDVVGRVVGELHATGLVDREEAAASALGALLDHCGVTSGIVAPLQTSSGEPMGLLVLGDRDASEPWCDDDVDLARALAELLGPVVTSEEQNSTIAELRKLRDELDFQASHDQLTGLANRSLFLRAVDECVTGPDPMSCVYVDLDGFKPVNDDLGHSAGDALLATVAERLRGVVRSGDLVARLGGDEFAILARATGDPATLATLARRIVDVLATPFDIGGETIVIGASVGIATAAPGEETASLIRRADAAMYTAKRNGRSQFCFADQG